MKNKKTVNLRLVIMYYTLLVWIFATTSAYAKDHSFSWSANPEPVEGYKLYYKKGGTAAAPFDGKAANEGQSYVNVGKKTMYTITGLEDNTTYHFAITAYNGNEESGFSEIITVFPADTATPAPIIMNIKVIHPSQ